MSAKRYPPRPSFQLHAIESGKTAIAKSIGLAMMPIPMIRFQFCNMLSMNMANK